MRNSIPTISSQTRRRSALAHMCEVPHNYEFEQKGTHNSRNKFASKFIGIHQPLEDTSRSRPTTIVHRRCKQKRKKNEPKRIINENNRLHSSPSIDPTTSSSSSSIVVALLRYCRYRFFHSTQCAFRFIILFALK